MDGTQEPAPLERQEEPEPQHLDTTETRASERVAEQPRLHESVSNVATQGDAAESSSPPFRSGQVHTPQGVPVMPYLATNRTNLVGHTADTVHGEIPEITLKDTLLKEVTMAELHPEHHILFMDDPGRGRGNEWRSIAGSASVRIHTCRGCSQEINRSTPCPTAQDLMLTLHLLASLEVETFTADVRTAFMQSEPGQRGREH
eukprot:1664667-Amphidinium_carterae.1